MKYGRYIGIDVGEKRIGLARTDMTQSIVSVIGVFSPKNVFMELQRWVDKEEVLGFVVGIPYNSHDELTKNAQLPLNFISLLKKKFPDKKVITVDEWNSSIEAVERMVKLNIPRKKRRKKIDEMASVIILERFLVNI